MDKIPDSDKVLVPHKDNDVIRRAAGDTSRRVSSDEVLKNLILNDIAQMSKTTAVPEGKVTSLFPSNTDRNAEITEWLAYRQNFIDTYITLNTPSQEAITRLDALYRDLIHKYGNSPSFSPFWNENGNVNGLPLRHLDDSDVFPRHEDEGSALSQSQVTMGLRNEIAAYKQFALTYNGNDKDKYLAVVARRNEITKKVTRWYEQLSKPTTNLENELNAVLGAPPGKPQATEQEYNDLKRRIREYENHIDQSYASNDDSEYRARVLEHDTLVNDINQFNTKYDYHQNVDQKWIDPALRNPTQPRLFNEEELQKIRELGDKFRQVHKKVDTYKRASIPPARLWNELNPESSWLTNTYLDEFTPKNNYQGYPYLLDHYDDWMRHLQHISDNTDIPNIGAEINVDYDALKARIKAYNATLQRHIDADNNLLYAGLLDDAAQLNNDIDAYISKWNLNSEEMKEYEYLILDHVLAPKENLGPSPIPQPINVGKMLQYPFDRTGANPNNRVQEIYELTDENRNEFNYIIPRFAPFFADSIIVERLDTEDGNPLLLKKNQDYHLGGHFGEIRPFVGQARVESLVVFDDRRITGRYRVTYQTLGGPFVLDATGYAEQIANYLVNPFQTTWGEIVGKPIEYPPIPHGHDADELMGIVDVVNAIMELANGTRALVEEERKQSNILEGYLVATNEIKELSRRTSRQVSDALIKMYETSGKIRKLLKNNQVVNEVIGASLDDVDARNSQLREELKTYINNANTQQDQQVKTSLAELLNKMNGILDEMARNQEKKLEALKRHVDNDLVSWDKTNPNKVIGGNVLRYGENKSLLLPFGTTFALTNDEGLPTGVVKALSSTAGLTPTEKQTGKVGGIEYKDAEGKHRHLTAQDYNYYSNDEKNANYRLGYTLVNHDKMLRQVTARGTTLPAAVTPINAVDTLNSLNLDTVGNTETGTYLTLRDNDVTNKYMSPEYVIGNKENSFGYDNDQVTRYRVLDVGKLLPLLVKGVQELSNKQTALTNQSPVVANDVSVGIAKPNKVLKTNANNQITDLASLGLKNGNSTTSLETENNRLKVPGLSTGDIVMRKPDGSSDYEVNGAIKSLADSLKLDTNTTGRNPASSEGALDKLANLKVVNKGESGYAIDSNGLSDALGSVNNVTESDTTLGGTYLNTGSALGAVLLALQDAKAKLAAVNSRVDATNNNVAAIPAASNFIPRGKVATTSDDYTLPYQSGDDIILTGRNLYWTYDRKRIALTHYGRMVGFSASVNASDFIVDFKSPSAVRIHSLYNLAKSYSDLIDLGVNVQDESVYKDVSDEISYGLLNKLSPKKTDDGYWRLVESDNAGAFVSKDNTSLRAIIYRNLLPVLVGSVKHLGTKVTELDTRTNTLSGKVSALETTVSAHTGKLEQLAKSAAGVNEATIREVNNRIEEMRQLAGGANGQIGTITPRVAALEEKATNATSAIAAAQSTATAAKNKADTLEAGQRSLSTLASTAKATAESASQKAEANERVNTQNTSRIAALEQAAQTDRGEVTKAKQAATAAQTKADGAERKATANDGRITGLGNTVAGHTQKLTALEPKVASLEQDVTRLKQNPGGVSETTLNTRLGNYVPTNKVQSSVDDKADGKIVRFFGEGTIGKVTTINFNGYPLSASGNGDLSYSGRLRPRQINLTSDKRLKSDIRKLGGIDKVLALTGYSYRFKDSEEHSAGLLAQDVQQVLPEAVSQDENGYLSLDYNAVIALLVNAVKDQQAMIDILTEQVRRLTK
jgi:distal tail fiber protein|nr:MAG TPA: structural protein [Caudoviricetes sp.]